MSRIIGYKGSKIDRMSEWRTLLMLREFICKEDTSQIYPRAYEKNKRAYLSILKDYIST